MVDKIVIVGGVAGGMSCAARVKRLNDSMEVVIFEKGNDVSFANCGMPYYIGGIISEREKMLVQTPESLQKRYGLDVRVRHEVIKIDRETRKVTVKNLETGDSFDESYNKLVLSPGAAPFIPPIPGIDNNNVYVLNDLADMDRINEASSSAKNVVIVGGGFIGLELAENFCSRGIKVSIIELLDQVMAPMDKEMTHPLMQELQLNGVDVHLEETVESIEEDKVVLKSGKTIDCDIVCVSIGVRPTSNLAKDAGLKLGPRGHIDVNDHMCTSDAKIYAVGDAIQIKDWVTKAKTAIPLAGPANRQGRIAADNICGWDSKYRGSQGTSIVKLFNKSAAHTGLTEKRLKQLKKDYLRLYIHPNQHPGYYPDATPISIKVLFAPDGRIFGAQVVGANGVKAVIDTLASAMRGRQKVQDLEHMELAYSPQWGGAKDPINMIGFVASNIIHGDVEIVEADDYPEDIFWLDVRAMDETESGMVPGALNISVDDLRLRFDELPKDKLIGLYCAIGLRGYIGYRFLKHKGYNVKNLNGGYRTWCYIHQQNIVAPEPPATEKIEECAGAVGYEPAKTIKLDVCGMQCPGPISKVKETIATVKDDEVLEVQASDPGFASDIPAWCKATGNTLLDVKPAGSNYIARIKPGGAETKSQAKSTDGATLVCFSNDLDKALATFIIANGAVAMGKKTTVFCTFWGLNVLQKRKGPPVKKSFIERMLSIATPSGPDKLKLSRMNMAGMGTRMIKNVMKDKNVTSLPGLILAAQKQGVRLVACAMSMDLMGIKKEELIDGVEIGGVGDYIGSASESNLNLFV